MKVSPILITSRALHNIFLCSSAAHFSSFRNGRPLDEKAYKELESKGAFTLSSYDPKHAKDDKKIPKEQH